MPICQNCGRPFAEGQVCSCRQNTPYMNAPGQQGQQGIPCPNPQPQPGQQYSYKQLYQPGAEPPKKQANGCAIAAIVALVVLVVLAIPTAILVPAMIGYTRKSRYADAANAAKTCVKAAQSALVDMDSEGIDVSGTYIITNLSRESDVNPPLSASALHEKFDGYFEEYGGDGYEYFFVAEDGQVTYAAVRERDHRTAIGTYPPTAFEDSKQAFVGYDGSKVEVVSQDTGDDTFHDLFQNAKNSIMKLPHVGEEI